MDLGVVLASKLEPKSIKNLSKTLSKIRSDFEWILDGSWTEFGSILEAKLGPSWLQNRSKRGLKPMSKNDQKNDRKKVPQCCPGLPEVAPEVGGGL